MNRLHLFIDTNIFLNLYHFSDDDLEELNKVIVLLESNNIVIYTTNQLINEFYRNRDEKLREALEATKKIFPTTQFPNIYKSYSEYEEIKELLKKFSNAKSRLDDRLLNDIFAKRLKADIIIEHIIEESKKLSPDNNIIDKAKERLDL